MAKFLQLAPEDRHEALLIAAARSGRPSHLLEKDVWVVWALSVLYGSSFGAHLVFKGGTSLSKAYGVIRRFSEDVDLTYDIRALVPHLVGEVTEALPDSRSQQKRWTEEVRRRLPEWIRLKIGPLLNQALAENELEAQLRIESEKVFIDYKATTEGTGYVAPSVMLEFGARSTGEPATIQSIHCDADGLVDGVHFPTARPRVMHAERTFWEKATAIHVFCIQQRLRGDRFARHWHDLSRLDRAGFATKAFADRELGNAVARHKALFFAEKAADQSAIDYGAAVNRGLRLVPKGVAAKALAEDYARMVDDGLLLEGAEDFDTLMAECAGLEKRANA